VLLSQPSEFHRKLGLEGIISKHRKHAYRSGRSKTWLKIKNPTAPGVTRFERQ
jgi:ATP-dependent DNA ligase